MSNQPIITRAEAKARGLKRYFTGKPCKNGHISEKTYPGCACLLCDKAWQINFRIRKSLVKDEVRVCKVCSCPFTCSKFVSNVTCSGVCSKRWNNKQKSLRLKAKPRKRKHTAERLKSLQDRKKKAYLALRVLKELGINI